jgi:hypothetical protein
MGPNGKAIGHSTPSPQMAGWDGILTDDMYTCRHVLFWTRCPIVPLFAPLRPTTKRRTWDAECRTNITTKTEGHVQHAALHSLVALWRDITDPSIT